MLNPLLLEVINGALMIGGVALMIVFVRYLRSPKSSERGRAVVRAIATFIAGDTIIRSWLWLWRNQINDGGDVSWMAPYPVPVIGGAIAIVGMVWMLRVFSFSSWSPLVWIGIAVAALATLTTAAIM